MSLVTTPGAADADSYATVAETDTYVTQYKQSPSVWMSLGIAKKEAALRQATQLLDRNFTWEGDAAVPATQALQHPRTDLTDRFGEDFSSTAILPEVKTATMELAVHIVENGDSGSSGSYSSVRIGSSLSFQLNGNNTRQSYQVPKDVFNIISPWAKRSTSTRVVYLTRA